MHERFKNYHIRGEWFSLKLVDIVSAIESENSHMFGRIMVAIQWAFVVLLVTLAADLYFQDGKMLQGIILFIEGVVK